MEHAPETVGLPPSEPLIDHLYELVIKQETHNTRAKLARLKQRNDKLYTQQQLTKYQKKNRRLQRIYKSNEQIINFLFNIIKSNRQI